MAESSVEIKELNLIAMNKQSKLASLHEQRHALDIQIARAEGEVDSAKEAVGVIERAQAKMKDPTPKTSSA